MRLTYIIHLAWKALLNRKIRSLVTIGGMVIGIGAIVFLVSLGYGLQRLVTEEVTELQALRLIEVTTEKASVLPITNETLATLAGLEHVDEVHPLVSLAGRIRYSEANVDIVLFGASNRYLELSGIYPEGSVFRETSGTAAREAIISTPVAKILGVADATTLIGKPLEIDVVLTSTLAPSITDTETRTAGAYTVVGVVNDPSAPYLYLPFSELTAFGVERMSQAMVRVTSSDYVEGTRQAIETLGYRTSSVVDTIAQINQVFGVFRIVLGAVGAIALIIAALGMFNTLTVSLLERTRELGFMKALGTQNGDVYRIFLIEALIISVVGGVLGILAGYYGGELANLVLNILARRTGNPEVDTFITPWTFTLAVLGFSFVIGLITGLYPARRAAKINPLDALRYE